MYLVFTSPGCSKCIIVKNILTQKNIPYKEVDVAASDDNLKLAQNLGVTTGGTIINNETKQIVNLEEII